MSRGIFEADRLKFALYVIRNLFPNDLPDSEWNAFVGRLNSGKTVMEETPLWIPKHCLAACQNLQVNFSISSLFLSVGMKKLQKLKIRSRNGNFY